MTTDPISNCCGVSMPNHPESDICPACGEHCEAESATEEDANYENMAHMAFYSQYL